MLDSGFRAQMADGLLTYADRQVLVETSYLSPPPDYLSLLYELRLEAIRLSWLIRSGICI